MADRKRLALWTAVALVVFLGGFIPQYRQARALRGELRAAEEQIRSLEWKMKLAEFRDLAGIVYLATNQQNYGMARQHSTQLFDRASELIREAPASELQALFGTILQQRDEVTARLTRGDGSIREPVEKLYIQVAEQTK
jgi:hypothetical protein